MIFQDFVRYDMRCDENVEWARSGVWSPYLEEARDAPAGAATEPPRPRSRISQQSLASSLIPKFDAGYRQDSGAALLITGVDLWGANGRRSRSPAPPCGRPATDPGRATAALTRGPSTRSFSGSTS